jgi:hypothetical protein
MPGAVGWTNDAPRQTLEPPQYVYWYHNDKIINYDTKRTRVSFDLGRKKEKFSTMDRNALQWS